MHYSRKTTLIVSTLVLSAFSGCNQPGNAPTHVQFIGSIADDGNLYTNNRFASVEFTPTSSGTITNTEVELFRDARCGQKVGIGKQILQANINRAFLEGLQEATYYVGAKHNFSDGTSSAITCGARSLTVDFSGPSAPGAIQVLNASQNGSTFTLREGALSVKFAAATDPESGISSYKLAKFQNADCSGIPQNLAIGITPADAASGSSVRLDAGEYALGVYAYNNAGSAGATTCLNATVVSNGVTGADCVAIRRGDSTKDRMHIIIMGSGFGGQTNEIRNYANKIEAEMQKHSSLNSDVGLLDVSYVNATAIHDSFCEPGQEIRRLFSCATTQENFLSSACPSERKTVVVIHKSFEYGGAGGGGVAVVTTAGFPSVASTVIHELGHALFGFGDEYTFDSRSTAQAPNCDYERGQNGYSRGCEKWADLMDDPNFSGVGCVSGCTG